MNYVKIRPKSLAGKIKIPPSKSLSHRAIICGALSSKESNIDNLVFSDDIIVTLKAMENLGAKIKKTSTSSLRIKGSLPLKLNGEDIYCKESGSTLRFLIPISLLARGKAVFRGEGKLVSRPLDPYYKIFNEQNIKYKNTNGSLPLVLEGLLKPGDFKIEGNISSQFVTGLMFVLPLLEETSKIIITKELESKAYVDLTIDILNKFGVKIKNNDHKEFIIKGKQEYTAKDYTIEGDFSQGAFWLVAGVLGDKINVEGLNIDSIQGDKAILKLIQGMGGKIDIKDSTIIVEKSKTKGKVIDASQFPDIVPILAVLAAVSQGETRIINAGRLRIKESDRLKAMTTELNKLGGDIKELEDGLVIIGKESLSGGIVDSWNDHRIAMALAIASIKCREDLIITNSHVVKKSYPHFWDDFKKIGGDIDELSMGR